MNVGVTNQFQVFELPIPCKLLAANLQIRQPFKDVLDTSVSSEEESLSGKSYVAASPMSVDKTLSPISRPSKSMLKKLYDCDTYSEEILNYLKSMEVSDFIELSSGVFNSFLTLRY